LVLRKIIKIVATRCQILRLKCIKFDFGPDPLAGFKGPTSKGRGGEGRGGEMSGEKGRGREGKGREGREGREREGRAPSARRAQSPKTR